jgi:transcriptional regulator with XRE-family HTH domain
VQDTENQLNIGSKIQEWREAFGISRAYFEKEFGISSNTLKAIEYGINKPSKHQAHILTKAFRKIGVPVDIEFFTQQELMQNPLDEQQIMDFSFSEDFQIEKEINFIKKRSPDLIFFKIFDDDMSPFFHPSDVVAGSKTMQEKWGELEGKFCILENELKLKCVRRISYIKNNLAKCTILNQNKNNFTHTENINIVSIAPISRHWIFSNIIR